MFGVRYTKQTSTLHGMVVGPCLQHPICMLLRYQVLQSHGRYFPHRVKDDSATTFSQPWLPIFSLMLARPQAPQLLPTSESALASSTISYFNLETTCCMVPQNASSAHTCVFFCSLWAEGKYCHRIVQVLECCSARLLQTPRKPSTCGLPVKLSAAVKTWASSVDPRTSHCVGRHSRTCHAASNCYRSLFDFVRHLHLFTLIEMGPLLLLRLYLPRLCTLQLWHPPLLQYKR